MAGCQEARAPCTSQGRAHAQTQGEEAEGRASCKEPTRVRNVEEACQAPQVLLAEPEQGGAEAQGVEAQGQTHMGRRRGALQCCRSARTAAGQSRSETTKGRRWYVVLPISFRRVWFATMSCFVGNRGQQGRRRVVWRGVAWRRGCDQLSPASSGVACVVHDMRAVCWFCFCCGRLV